MLLRSLICALSGATLILGPAIPADRRIVDTVIAGDAESEQAHGYAGHDDSAGIASDSTYREARGWMRYALTTFDDTEVTLACAFLASPTTQYDVVVEDSVIARSTLKGPGIVEVRVPFAVTRGRTNIAVTLRGRDGATPRLHSIRVLQDHHELYSPSAVHHLLGVAR